MKFLRYVLKEEWKGYKKFRKEQWKTKVFVILKTWFKISEGAMMFF